MLDSEAKAIVEDDTADQADQVEDAPEVEAEDAAPVDDGEIVITIEGEEPEADDDAEVEAELGDKGRNALRAAREAAKLARQEARELKAKLASMEPPKAKPELKRPTLEDCGFNEDTFADQMAAYVAAKKEADAEREAEESAFKARETTYQEKLTRYHAERAKVGVDDDAQSVVTGALNMQQQTALMDASGDPAKVVAALAKTPKILAELSGIKEIHKFTYRLAQIEGKIQMTAKAPPPPETKLRGSIASPGGSLAAQLDAAEKRAEQTGDRSEVVRIKRQMQAAGVKA